jgi:hypothetical protein
MITMSRAIPFHPILQARSAIIAVLCLVLALQSGCSAIRLGYGQAPDLVYWWLDSYADFDDVQTPRLRDSLAAFFAWHRQTQLPDYAALLERWRAEAPANTTPERACAAWGDVRKRIDIAVERALPAAAELALTLAPEQLRHMERHYAESNSKFRDEFMQSDPARRLREAVKRTVDRVEMVYGRLDDTQTEQITQWVARSPYDADAALAERERRQQDLLATLRRLIAEHASPAQAGAALRAYAERVARSPREKFRAYADTLEQYNCGVAALIHNATSAEQRQAAVLRLRGWEGDFRALSGGAGAR